MEIRGATTSDTQQLGELLHKEIAFYQGIGFPYDLLPDFDWAAYAGQIVSGPENHIFVAVNSRIIVGFIHIRIIGSQRAGPSTSLLARLRKNPPAKKVSPIKSVRRGVVEQCFVLPTIRRQGVGSRLLKNALQWFQTQKINRIELSVLVNNTEAEPFWTRHGFEPFRLVMSKEIKE